MYDQTPANRYIEASFFLTVKVVKRVNPCFATFSNEPLAKPSDCWKLVLIFHNKAAYLSEVDVG